MQVPFSARGRTYTPFTLTIDRDWPQASYHGDVVSLTFQATIERMGFWDTQLGGASPLLLSLHGALYRDQTWRNVGAMLLPLEGLPLPVPTLGDKRQVRLAFACSRRYIEHLEDERAAQPDPDLALSMRLWGSVALMRGQADEGEDAAASAPISFESVEATPVEMLRIPRSDWIDRLLPALGYRKTVLLELPLAGRSEVPEDLRDAIRHLDEAHVLRNHESYQKAIQECRRATDALLGSGPEKKAWCQTHLAPLIGAEKAKMVDDSLWALRPLLNATSHGYAPVEVDRDAADYAIESLTVAFNDIARKLV